MKQKEINVLMVAPGEHSREDVLKNDQDALQKAVSIGCDYQGLIEVIGLDDGVCIVCNVESAKRHSAQIIRHEKDCIRDCILGFIKGSA